MPTIRMSEWDEATPVEYPELANFSFGSNRGLRSTLDALAQKPMLEVLELRTGLVLRSTSYVGNFQLGDLRIIIQPKIKLDVLLTLFRYAYQLRDLQLMETSRLDTEPKAFQNILIEQLIAEVSELLNRGLRRQYQRVAEGLVVPKGQLDLQRLARQGGVVEARLPVVHHPRLEDSLINQVLLEGLYFATRLTNDIGIRSRLRRLAGLLEVDVSRTSLDFSILQRLRHGMNRLTVHYEPAITLIEMLLRSVGITLEDRNDSFGLPGFLFDMNRFFERLLSRFLNENLPELTVHDQYRLTGMMAYSAQHNPRLREAPTPRPDFVITTGKTVMAILDAKYRDLWEKPLPREMLYQLAIYALSQGWNGQSSILYPCLDSRAEPQIINIREAMSSTNKAHVILRPVNMTYLSQLLEADSFQIRRQRQDFARQLVRSEI